ncbi:MAG: alpha/beta hydrolase [Vicinamibacterales bacterium]
MREVHVAGHRLEVVHHPPQDPCGPTIVFLHEGLGSTRQWKDFPTRLASLSGCGFLVYSRWGYGRSEARPRPWPADFLEDEAAVALPELLATAGIMRPVLFGHSDGATIALMYAAAVPGGVRGVISEAAHVMLEDIGIEGITRARDRFLHGDLRARLHRQHGEHVEDTVLGWTGNWLRPELRNWDIRERLRAVRCPVLVIQGRDDDFGTLDQVDAIVTHVAGPTTTLVLDECGHIPHREKPRDVLEAAASFIRRLREPVGASQKHAEDGA